MKNIHVIKSDKPSRLTLLNGERLLFSKEDCEVSKHKRCINQHIYITSDVEIKEGDWIFHPIYKTVYQWIKNANLHFDRIDAKKIILTTEPQLIADGIQEINETFLKWFVKNPSCEKVIVEIDYNKWKKGNITISNCYEIIIPKEEPKQTVEQYEQQGLEKYAYEFQQETLEEAAFESSIDYKPFEDNLSPKKYYEYGFIKGVEWQAEKMYSEEDLVQLLNFVSREYNISNGIGWFHTHESNEDVTSKEVLDKFKQFKKK